MIVLVAGLRSLPEYVYEAAALDGLGPVETFFKITLPLLRPVILIVLLLRFMDAFKLMDLVFMLTKGGPAGRTETLSYFIYVMGLQLFRVGLAAAASILFLIFISIADADLRALHVPRAGERGAARSPEGGWRMAMRDVALGEEAASQAVERRLRRRRRGETARDRRVLPGGAGLSRLLPGAAPVHGARLAQVRRRDLRSQGAVQLHPHAGQLPGSADRLDRARRRPRPATWAPRPARERCSRAPSSPSSARCWRSSSGPRPPTAWRATPSGAAATWRSSSSPPAWRRRSPSCSRCSWCSRRSTCWTPTSS